MRALGVLLLIVQHAVGHSAAAAPLGDPEDDGADWARVAEERTRSGDYAAALDAYGRLLASGDTRPSTLVNSAELLMALGRVREAVEQYREAVEIEERAPNRREHVQGLALGYFGLAVALDRDARPVAAREAAARGLAFDPGLGTLATAARAGGDLYLVPPGDVFYYLGLARLVQGRSDDALAAFRDYLRVAKGPYVRFARAHIARLETTGGASWGRHPSAGRPLLQPRFGPRAPATAPSGAIQLLVRHHVTLEAVGPLVAPLIDAAWRMNGRLLDSCLSEVEIALPLSDDHDKDNPHNDAGAAPEVPSFRVSLDLKIEATGQVSAASAKVPRALAASGVGPCIENALRTRFQISRPAARKPTRVRMDVVLAPAPPGGL